MTERSLQATYRKGRPFSAYLHLSHPTGEKSARTVASPDGLLVVDYSLTALRHAATRLRLVASGHDPGQVHRPSLSRKEGRLSSVARSA